MAALQGYQELKLGIVLKLALGAVGALLIVQAALGAPTAAGVWRQVDETGKASALVTITEDGGVFAGRLSHLFLDPGDDPNPICNQCPGDKRNQPVLGLVFIEGMKQSGLDYDSGTILDPETGKVYSANMHLSADGALLTVRGYLGLSIFGRSQTWVRVESGDGASAPVDRAPR